MCLILVQYILTQQRYDKSFFQNCIPSFENEVSDQLATLEDQLATLEEQPASLEANMFVESVYIELDPISMLC